MIFITIFATLQFSSVSKILSLRVYMYEIATQTKACSQGQKRSGSAGLPVKIEEIKYKETSIKRFRS
jgi:hypothetical protein